MDDRTRQPDPGTGTTRTGGTGRAVVHGLLALVVLGAGVAGGWYFLLNQETVGQRTPPERSARLVQTTPARVAPAVVSVTAWGEVRPSRQLALRPRVAGRVASLADGLEPGAFVPAGTELLRIDPAPFEIDLRRARTALTRARADLNLEQGQQAVARREFELLGQPAAEAERALMLREPQLASARAAVAAAEADVADAERALGYTTLTAPFDALVRDTDVAVGAEVNTGTTVAQLVGVDTWWIELAVPVTALQWVNFPGENRSGSTVELDYEGVWPADARRTGRVVRLLGDLEENGRLARVLVAVDDPLARGVDTPGPRLLVGSFLRASVRGRTLPGAVALEPGWLRPDDTVWVMDAADRLSIRSVTVAYRDATRVLVTDGLAEGDRIVTSPLALPTEGMPLRDAAAADDADDA